MDLGLKNKIALVVASSKGLGFAAAKELLKEGSKVVICGRSQANLEVAEARLRKELGNEIILSGCISDLNKPESAEKLVKFTADQFGGLDILITNAGGPAKGIFATLSSEAFKEAIDLNFMSAVNLIKASLPYLKKSNSPSILTVTSISVKEPIFGLHLSNVIRPAVIGLTKSLSQEFGKEGIRVNSVLPGWTATERVEYLLESSSKQNNTTVKEEKEKITAAIPLGRMGYPEEFGRVATFLSSPAASYINGVMLQVDGGAYRGIF